jgi:tetratricopeptide (TPR) repeat protein
MVRFLTTILPKSAERRKPPFEPTHVEKAQLQNYRRALSIQEQKLGPMHGDRAQSLHDLGHLLHDRGRFEEAEELLREALKIRESLLGKDHHYMAQTLHRLANVCRARHKYKEAENYFRRVLEIWSQTIGGNRFDLRLMSSLNDVSGIPTEGRNLIIVATVNNELHFRVFDGGGKVVVDTDEKRLTEQARQIEDLRKQLESSCTPHELSRSDKDRVVAAVTSIVGHTRGDHPYMAEPLEDYASLLRDLSRPQEAEEKEAWAKGIRRRTGLREPMRGH